MPGRHFTVENGYRYGFNGKENDNEAKGVGTQIEYGARVLDPRIGKFLSQDMLSKSSETPYSFVGNCPTSFIDLGGYFRISPYFAKKYPTLAKVLETIIPEFKNNKKIRDQWIINMGFDDEQVGIKAWEEMVTFGTGPWVTPNRPESEFNGGMDQNLENFFPGLGGDGGEYTPWGYNENIRLGTDPLARLETVLKKGDGKEVGYQVFVVVMKVMHEGSHWARQKRVGKPPPSDYCYEIGARAEEAITGGHRFSYTKCHTSSLELQSFRYDLSRNYYLSEYNKKWSNGFQLGPKSFWVPGVGSVKTTKSLSEKIPKGQKGDPTMTSNNDERVFIPRRSSQSGGSSSSNKNNTYDYDD